MFFDAEDERFLNPELFRRVVHRQLSSYFGNGRYLHLICVAIQICLIFICLRLSYFFRHESWSHTVWIKICADTYRGWDTYQEVVRVESTSQGKSFNLSGSCFFIWIRTALREYSREVCQIVNMKLPSRRPPIWFSILTTLVKDS